MPTTKFDLLRSKTHSLRLSTQHPAFSTILCLFCGAALLLAACQPAAQSTPQTLPTRAVLPTLETTDEPSLAPTDTETVEVTIEPSATPTTEPSDTKEPSETPLPSDTLTPSRTPTRIPAPTERPTSTPTFPTPVYSTFTPLPPGTLPPPGTPQQIADVVISRQALQNVINTKIGDYSSIQQANIAFTPGGIRVELTALGGQAFITGEVFISIQVSNGVAAISPTEITVNAAEPPEAYIEVVNGDFFLMMVDAFDTILKDRLGSDQDLENIVISGDNMLVTLLVPRNG